MAAQKKMVIRVTLDGQNDLRFTAPQTKPNIAKLVEAFGEAHVIVPRNIYGRKGKPAAVKAAEAKAAKATKKVAKPRAKRTTKPAAKVTATA